MVDVAAILGMHRQSVANYVKKVQRTCTRRITYS
ncbi:hypothetical protein ACT7C1_35030 [Bacillus paranthracis]